MRTCSSFRTSFRHIQRLRHARKHSPTVAPRPQMLPMLMTESNDRVLPPIWHTQDGFLSVSPLKVYMERDDFNEN